MPTYEYECGKCRKRFEIFQSMKDEPLKECPECGEEALKRLIGTGAGIIFKGSGFYCTDYRSDSYNKAKESDKKTDKAGADSSKGSSSNFSTESKA
jgi:putative FmdB family regulatory protein